MSKCKTGRLTLMSYLADDLDIEKKSAMREHIFSCKKCRDKIEELQKENELFLENHPFDALGIRIENKPKTRRLWTKYYSIAACLVLSLTVLFYYQGNRKTSLYRIKGNTGIKFFSRDQNNRIILKEKQEYFPGERIQITYSCSDKNNIILFSLDEKGTVSVYYPQNDDSSRVLKKGSDIPLPNSIELDNYIGRELFVALFSKEKLYIKDVLRETDKAFSRAGNLEKFNLSGSNDRIIEKLLIVKRER